jgi:hypothetical protein
MEGSRMIKPTQIPAISCPQCGADCKVRIKHTDHINKHTKTLKKQKYYQYYCEKCDNDETGWTTTESDKLSLKIK